MENTQDKSPFRVRTRSDKFTIFALGLILFSAAQLFYRFTLPTDGWLVFTTDNFEQPDWVAWENLVGAPSGLQQEDLILGVNGQSVQGRATLSPVPRPPGWEGGQAVTYEIIRSGETQSLLIPLNRWTLPAITRHFIARPEIAVGLISSLLLAGLAFFTHARKPEARAARHLLITCAAFLAINLSGILPDGLSVQFNLLAFYLTGIFGYLLFPVLLAPSLLAFTLVFPREKASIGRRPWLGMLPYGIGLLLGVILLIPGSPSVIDWLGTLGMVAAAMLSLLHAGFSQRDLVSQSQFRVAVFGIALGMGLMLFVFPAAADWVGDPLLAQILGAGFYFGFAVITVFLAIAILRYRLFDLDLIIHRTLIYAILSAISIAIYIGVVGYLGFLFKVENNLWQSLIAAGVVAVTFAPLRENVRQLVSRFVYGDREDPYLALTRLGGQLENAVEPSAALSLALENITRSLKVPYAALVLQVDDKPIRTLENGTTRNPIQEFPLIYGGKPIGTLRVGTHSPGESLTPPDIRLLTDLSRPISSAAQAVILNAELEQARLRLVQEREATRRQLGRDLHDGLGHRLTALSRRVEHLKGEEGQIPLDEIQAELTALTRQARQIAHQLFPPELELLGLPAALEERAHTLPNIRLSVQAAPDFPPKLTPAAEAALYYIALEALTNIQKHSQAQSGRIRLQVVAGSPNQHLEMVIQDDGIGFAPQNTPGIGLRSMSARAAELEGTCQVESIPGQGTLLRVRIPLATQEIDHDE